MLGRIAALPLAIGLASFPQVFCKPAISTSVYQRSDRTSQMVDIGASMSTRQPQTSASLYLAVVVKAAA